MSGQSMLTRVLKSAVERGAADVHAKAGDVFRARVDGHLVPLTKQRLTPEQTRALAATFAGLTLDDPRLDQLRDFDCSWGIQGVGRFRVNVLRQRSSFMVVLRVIPFSVPSPGGAASWCNPTCSAASRCPTSPRRTSSVPRAAASKAARMAKACTPARAGWYTVSGMRR